LKIAQKFLGGFIMERSKRKKHLWKTIRIDEKFKDDLERVHNDLNNMLHIEVSETYALRMLIAMGFEAYNKAEGLPVQ
jgi:hypothetical protein